MEMASFKSKTLNRTFDRIIFSGGALNQGESNETDLKKKGHAGTNMGTTTQSIPAEKIKVSKATGADAYSIAELYEKSASLHKHKIVVKGKVVKVSEGIMGKNWIHLHDGTGAADKGTDNLVVTTLDTAKVGDVVTMKGTLYKDKDFGSGYAYKLIIEEAQLQK